LVPIFFEYVIYGYMYIERKIFIVPFFSSNCSKSGIYCWDCCCVCTPIYWEIEIWKLVKLNCFWSFDSSLFLILQLFLIIHLINDLSPPYPSSCFDSSTVFDLLILHPLSPFCLSSFFGLWSFFDSSSACPLLKIGSYLKWRCDLMLFGLKNDLYM